jgi:hypothetical protein
MKFIECSDCRESKPLDMFNAKGKWFQTYCKSCQSIRAKAWYRKNMASHKSNCIASAVERRAFLRKIVDAKKAVACADCKNEFPVICMDFDHVRGNKVGNIASLASGRSGEKKLFDELEKCEVVCSNCHRIRTAERAGYRVRSIHQQLASCVIASTTDSESVSAS